MACGGVAAYPGAAQAPRWRCLHAAAVQSVCSVEPTGGDQAHSCLLQILSKPAVTAGLLAFWSRMARDCIVLTWAALSHSGSDAWASM